MLKNIFKFHSVIPGFKLAFGWTIFYLGLIVLLPISGLFINESGMTFQVLWATVNDHRVLASLRLTFLMSALAAVINVIFGFMIAWAIVRQKIFGRKIIDALVDLPFALPTAVAGITLSGLFGTDGFYGKILSLLGINVSYTNLGILVALVFVGIPFVVRSIQPVLEDFDLQMEEAAICLGADKWEVFSRITLPTLFPSMITGFTMAFARGVGEYGSVVFIASNIPMKSEIVSLLIMSKLEQYNYNEATAVAIITLTSSFGVLFFINMFHRINKKFL